MNDEYKKEYLDTLKEVEREILNEINKRRIEEICGFGISIKEINEREKRGEPIELSKWIEWYFKRLKEKVKQ